MIRDDNSILTLERKEKLIDELGDVCWYVARLATELDMPFSKILARNREKLNDRLARGKIQGSGDNR
jgi:NTP pyrophosphatase (non-canonical NTP hydrolase)